MSQRAAKHESTEQVGQQASVVGSGQCFSSQPSRAAQTGASSYTSSMRRREVGNDSRM